MAHTRKIHLGERSLGRSSSGQELLSLRGTAPNLTTEFVAFEADDAQAWERLGNLAWVLADEDVPSYLRGSRRGGDLWLFLSQSVGLSECQAAFILLQNGIPTAAFP